ncbi:MAG: hypothetical protein ACSNEK_09735 [Parachlamydiaceae bacterium]
MAFQFNVSGDKTFSYEHFTQVKYESEFVRFHVNPGEGSIELGVACRPQFAFTDSGNSIKWFLGVNDDQKKNELRSLNAKQINALLLNHFMYRYLDAGIPYEIEGGVSLQHCFANDVLIIVKGLNEYHGRDREVKKII